MKFGVGMVVLALMVIAAAKAEKTSGGLPPLKIDRSAPLMLDDPPEEDPFAVPEGPVVDNTACYCCHTNYEEDPFVVYHAKANVGCMKCHGKSLDHRNDEGNIIPPDQMFPPEAIAANCKECHDRHNAPPAKVIALWQERCSEKTNPDELLCTDCHGQHRLTIRTVRWNKKTGELVLLKCE